MEYYQAIQNRAAQTAAVIKQYVPMTEIGGADATKLLSQSLELGRLAQARDALPAAGRVPMFLKVAPDLEDGEVEAIVETVVANGLEGIIVSNTTISRPQLASKFAGETGGLSGAPLMALSTRMLGAFAQAADGRVALIGAGGIGSGQDAYAKIRAGASAVQLYSAMVFGGPGLITRIKRELAACLRRDGFASVAQAVGAH